MSDLHPEMDGELIASEWARRAGDATIPIYCDECGELKCEHRCSVCWRPLEWCRCDGR